MKKITFSSILLVSLIMFSCRDNNADSFDNQQDITATDSFVIEGINDFNKFLVANDSLWILNTGTENFVPVKIFNLKGDLLAEGGKRGNASNEMLQPSMIRRLPNGKMGVYDTTKGTIFTVSVNGNTAQVEPFMTGIKGFPSDIALLAGGYMIELPLVDHAYVMLKDGVGVDTLDYYPPRPEGVNEKTHAIACTGKMTLSPDGKHMARTVTFDGGVDFFSLKDGKIEHIKRFAFFNQDYATIDRGGMQLPIVGSNTKVGFLSISASEKYFYATFSDAKSMDNPTGEADDIYVFTHDGKPVKHLKTKQKVMEISVTPDDTKLFSMSADENGETRMLVFNLK